MLEKKVSVRKDLAEAITEIIDETKIEELEEAKKTCPVGAIEIE